MGADSLAENTPNTPEFICPICPWPNHNWKSQNTGGAYINEKCFKFDWAL
jgi:hypothetical protein